ncbi:aspartyl-phosphate phosphatase Spo0E family protein [Paenibacillus humicola]|uniref:aspartyl-phosphate phosphatase Spo0E family protein n=1 Tax=Paenibacillus humicola TaxID=3110540 RepID=UPI00237ABED8|nr:aspartyl-phosphate phosphatase Spo0E family protein [Paenibacillus humicola]
MDNLTSCRLESLRGQLVSTAMRENTFLHRDVLQLSQSLDQLIVKVQTEKRESLAGRK